MILARGDRSKVRLPSSFGAVGLSLVTEPDKKFSAPLQLSLFEVRAQLCARQCCVLRVCKGVCV